MISWKKLSIKSNLIIMLLGVSLGSILVIGYLGWSRVRVTLKERIFEQLTSVRASKAYQLEFYIQTLRNHVETLCEDRMVVAAMVEFNKEFKQLNQKYIELDWIAKIKEYYQDEFFVRLSNNVIGTPNFETYNPTTQAAQYLQYYYIAQNPHPVGEKDQLVDPQDNSEYSKYHQKYHRIFQNLIKKFGYYDLFLINFQTGEIVYSVYKETDFATNLDEGPYRNSNLAAVVEAVRQNPDRGAIAMVDFKPYRPSYMAPAAFFAGPIYNGPHIVGILAIQMPVDEINNVLTGNQKWKQDGLGETGETYIVGSDFLMRSMSRFLIEEPKKYEASLRAIGTSESNINLIQQLQTSILLQKVETEGVKEAISGKEGTKIIRDYRGIPVLSSYSPLNIKGVDWAILAEMDLTEAYLPVYNLQQYLFISTIIIILLLTAIATFAANKFVQPIDTMIHKTRQVKAGKYNTEILLDSNSEFKELGQIFNDLVEEIRHQNQLVKRKNQENEALLLNMLPSSIVQRIKQGEEFIANDIQQLTLLFMNLDGLSQLATQDVKVSANQLTQLFDVIDESARKHEIETLEAFGRRYVAVCGLSKPRLDHSGCTIDFALEIIKIIQDFNQQYKIQLSPKIGIASGKVSAGIIGTHKFTYSLWGKVVNLASYLSYEAETNTILVTSDIQSRLNKNYNFKLWKTITFEEDSVQTWVVKKQSFQDWWDRSIPRKIEIDSIKEQQ